MVDVFTKESDMTWDLDPYADDDEPKAEESYDLDDFLESHPEEPVWSGQENCPYCLQPSDSSDPNVLCPKCREDFGHTMIGEL